MSGAYISSPYTTSLVMVPCGPKHVRKMKCDIIKILLTFLPAYLLTPWSTVLLEKLTGSQLIKKFPIFYGTRGFITAFTSARQMSLS